jgi:hypothetical protein
VCQQGGVFLGLNLFGHLVRNFSTRFWEMEYWNGTELDLKKIMMWHSSMFALKSNIDFRYIASDLGKLSSYSWRLDKVDAKTRMWRKTLINIKYICMYERNEIENIVHILHFYFWICSHYVLLRMSSSHPRCPYTLLVVCNYLPTYSVVIQFAIYSF